MNETKGIVYWTLPCKVCGHPMDGEADRTLFLAHPGETLVTLAKIETPKRQCLKWACWMNGCDHDIRFYADQVWSAPFRIVRHLLEDHGLSREEVLEMTPFLTEEVRDVLETPGRGTPVDFRPGVPTKVGTMR